MENKSTQLLCILVIFTIQSACGSIGVYQDLVDLVSNNTSSNGSFIDKHICQLNNFSYYLNIFLLLFIVIYLTAERISIRRQRILDSKRRHLDYCCDVEQNAVDRLLFHPRKLHPPIYEEAVNNLNTHRASDRKIRSTRKLSHVQQTSEQLPHQIDDVKEDF